jgi:hypothetical protein
LSKVRAYQTAGLVALFLGVMASAFTGTQITLVKLNPDCLDGIDNNGNGFSDFNDPQCQQYPFEDGNAESGTLVQDRWQGEGYILSIFEVNLQYGTQSTQETCDGWVNGADGYYYDLQYVESGGKDTSYTDGLNWINQNCS